MKLLNEIISDLIKVEELFVPDYVIPGSDTSFDESDPEQLCDECKAIGFCRRLHPEKFKVYRQETLPETIAL